MVLKQPVPGEINETARIGRAEQGRADRCRLSVHTQRLFNGIILLLDVHARRGDPAEQNGGTTLGIEMAHLAFRERQTAINAFDHAFLEFSQGAVENIRLVLQGLGTVLDHPHFTNIRAGGIVTSRPEPVRRGPLAGLLIQCLSGAGRNVLGMIFELRVGILHVDAPTLLIGKPERTMPGIPVNQPVILVFDAPEYRALEHIPHIVAWTLGQAGSDDP